APLRSNSSSASCPVAATAVVKPSLRNRNASGSAKDSSSSTMSTLVMDLLTSPDAVGYVDGPARGACRLGVGLCGRGGAGGRRARLDVHGEPHRERRPGARAAPQPHLAAVVGEHVLDDRQAQAGAAGGA